MEYIGWTKDRDATLTRLWGEDLSASAIAQRMGGTTRNAVIGRVRRLKLPFRNPYRAGVARNSRAQDDIREVPRSRIKRMAVTKQPTWRSEPLPESTHDDIARVSFLDLEDHHCRFIPGDPRTIRSHEPQFCGLQKVEGGPYCSHHMRRCCTPFIVKKQDTYRAPSPAMREGARSSGKPHVVFA